MAEFIYTLRKARKAHGDKVILDDVTLSFLPGAKIGVVGPNGAGKSTVLKIMAGLDQPSNGDAMLAPGYTVGLLQQEPALNEAKDARRLPPGDADVCVLSGGERRRVALCKLLLQQPDLLLLDEPTNHLDAESVQWLEQHLAKYAGTVVAITHDRYFLDDVAQWILELDRGRAYPYEGNYSTYLEKKGERLKVQGKKDAKLAKRLADELDWVRSNAKGRQAKSKSRLARYEEMAAEADRTRKLDFEEIQIPPGPRLGSTVIEVKDLKKGFG